MTPRHAAPDHPPSAATAEHHRLADAPTDDAPWKFWGPYVAGRQWGTVREDYSADGDAWAHFPFAQAHTRAYRWGEDGLGGLCDRYGFLNITAALWNGNDDRLKERLFGLTNAEGNHGEDAKEYWWALEATPTHSYAEWLYRYPHAAFPYQQLVEQNAARGRDVDEYELADTGIFHENRFFDVTITHAKAAWDDVLITISATNHGPESAPLHIVPMITFRNTWSWGRDDRRPQLHYVDGQIACTHDFLGDYTVTFDGAPRVLVCDNETNAQLVFGADRNESPYPCDGINNAIVHGDDSGVNAQGIGTRAGLDYAFESVAPGETVEVRLRLRTSGSAPTPDSAEHASIVAARRAECDEFYAQVIPAELTADDRLIARRAFAGLMWGKQLYRYSVREWLEGDPSGPVPPPARLAPEPIGRNTSWRHFAVADVISMPDEWEYPWFATWDLAFHAVALAHIDPAFAKSQLLLLCREWAQHPDGQLPAYEWSFSDVNPPVHAWAAWKVYVADGSRDREFLTRITTKLLLNFGWWVNRKDADGSNLFEGGFLGMDNISVLDRSKDVPPGWRLEQSDATSWVAFMCLGLLRMSQELARTDKAWDDVATMCLERFLTIAAAMESFGTTNVSLWDADDEFFYDVLVSDDGEVAQLRVRSLVGLLPLLPVANAPEWVADELPDFTSRLAWVMRRRPDLCDGLVTTADDDMPTLALLDADRVSALLRRLLDEGEFLSPYGIRSLSASYRDGIEVPLLDRTASIKYVPGPGDTPLFGGNSNWRGPVWIPINVLLIDAISEFAQHAGSGVRVDLPTGSGKQVTLGEVSSNLRERLLALFRLRPDGRRPGSPRDFTSDPLWQGNPTFSEYFNGDDGTGCGATHQTGWTAYVAHLLCDRDERAKIVRPQITHSSPPTAPPSK